MRPRLFRLLVACVGLTFGMGVVWEVGAWSTPRGTRTEPVELALHYDLQIIEGAEVSDASGKNHHGMLEQGEIVFGRKKNAARFQGDGSIGMAKVPDTLDPQSRALTVGAFCLPESGDAVLVAMGDALNGFSLYLRDGVPHFAVRSDGELFVVVSDRRVTLNQWVHLAGVIDAQGELSVWFNGWSRAEMSGQTIANRPGEPLNVGADLGSPVGDYEAPMHWRGLVQDVRIYWGVMGREGYRDAWQEWADLPGCGCRSSASY
jgi:hypothetical protein